MTEKIKNKWGRGARTTLLLAGVLLSTSIWALGMGDIRVASHLNQPFSAFIPISGLGKLDPGELQATFASDSAHERAGLKRSGLLNQFDLSVQKKPLGIRIRSRVTVSEPLLQFLIDVRGGSQQIQRQFSVLMDPKDLFLPATTNPSPALNTQATPRVSTEAATPRATPLRAAARPRAQQPPAPKSRPTKARKSDWARNDDLEDIARKAAAQSPHLQWSQVLVALYQASQDALPATPNSSKNSARGSLNSGFNARPLPNPIRRSVEPGGLSLRFDTELDSGGLGASIAREITAVINADTPRLRLEPVEKSASGNTTAVSAGSSQGQATGVEQRATTPRNDVGNDSAQAPLSVPSASDKTRQQQAQDEASNKLEANSGSASDTAPTKAAIKSNLSSLLFNLVFFIVVFLILLGLLAWWKNRSVKEYPIYAPVGGVDHKIEPGVSPTRRHLHNTPSDAGVSRQSATPVNSNPKKANTPDSRMETLPREPNATPESEDEYDAAAAHAEQAMPEVDAATAQAVDATSSEIPGDTAYPKTSEFDIDEQDFSVDELSFSDDEFDDADSHISVTPETIDFDQDSNPQAPQVLQATDWASWLQGDSVAAGEPVESTAGDFDPSQEEPLAVSNIYLELGLYEQAAGWLQENIAADPQRLDLRLNLLNTYQQAGGRAPFIEHAKSLLNNVSKVPEAEWGQVRAWAADLCPEVAFLQAPNADAARQMGQIDPASDDMP